MSFNTPIIAYMRLPASDIRVSSFDSGSLPDQIVHIEVMTYSPPFPWHMKTCERLLDIYWDNDKRLLLIFCNRGWLVQWSESMTKLQHVHLSVLMWVGHGKQWSPWSGAFMAHVPCIMVLTVLVVSLQFFPCSLVTSQHTTMEGLCQYKGWYQCFDVWCLTLEIFEFCGSKTIIIHLTLLGVYIFVRSFTYTNRRATMGWITFFFSIKNILHWYEN